MSILRVLRMRKIFKLLQKKKRDADADYWRRFTYRALELILVTIFCLHLQACIFHYLATIPVCEKCRTWLTSLELRDDIDYSKIIQVFKERRYLISVYFALITMSTVGKSFVIMWLIEFKNLSIVLCL